MLDEIPRTYRIRGGRILPGYRTEVSISLISLTYARRLHGGCGAFSHAYKPRYFSGCFSCTALIRLLSLFLCISCRRHDTNIQSFTTHRAPCGFTSRPQLPDYTKGVSTTVPRTVSVKGRLRSFPIGRLFVRAPCVLLLFMFALASSVSRPRVGEEQIRRPHL